MRIISPSSLLAAAVVSVAALTSSAEAAFTISLPGDTEFSGWNNLNNVNYPGYPNGGSSTALWPAAITPNISGSAVGASLNKVSGGGYPASTATNALYNLFNAGNYVINETSPVDGLATVVFQFDLAGGNTAGEATPFANGVPSLSYNGGSQALAAAFTASQPGSFTGDFGGAAFSTTTYAFQWDLSSIGAPITDYKINWTTSPHTLTYELTLHSGDSFTQAVPEPSGMALALLGGITFLTGRKRKMGR